MCYEAKMLSARLSEKRIETNIARNNNAGKNDINKLKLDQAVLAFKLQRVYIREESNQYKAGRF